MLDVAWDRELDKEMVEELDDELVADTDVALDVVSVYELDEVCGN